MAGNETDSSPPPTGVRPVKVIRNTPVSPPARNGKSGRWTTSKPTMATPFKGTIPELANKVFITGPTQATRYDEAYKGLLHYFGKKSTIVSTEHLYYSDYDAQHETILLNDHDQERSINTVGESLKKFPRRQIVDARTARRYQNTAELTTKAVLRMVDSGALINSTITRESIRDAITICGPSVANLKGKTTRSRPDPVHINTLTITFIPPYILKYHGTIILCIDVLKVNKIPFLASISQVIKMGSATELTNLQVPTIVETITILLKIYASRGFKVRVIASDNGFNPLLEDETFLTFGIMLNLTSQDEHQPHVEHFIRTLKERCRMCFALL